MATPHINAPEGAFAEDILLPGDPLRAKFIAETFLTDVEQVTDVRNMFGYTGFYKASVFQSWALVWEFLQSLSTRKS